MSPVLRVEMALLFCERKFRLAATRCRSNQLLQRAVSVIMNIQSIKVERRGSNKDGSDFDPILMRLVQVLITALTELCSLKAGKEGQHDNYHHYRYDTLGMSYLHTIAQELNEFVFNKKTKRQINSLFLCTKALQTMQIPS